MRHSAETRMAALSNARRGYTSREIARALGIGHATVARWAREAGIKSRHSMTPNTFPVDRILKEIEDGARTVDICERYGCHRNTVLKMRRRHEKNNQDAKEAAKGDR